MGIFKTYTFLILHLLVWIPGLFLRINHWTLLQNWSLLSFADASILVGPATHVFYNTFNMYLCISRLCLSSICYHKYNVHSYYLTIRLTLKIICSLLFTYLVKWTPLIYSLYVPIIILILRQYSLYSWNSMTFALPVPMWTLILIFVDRISFELGFVLKLALLMATIQKLRALEIGLSFF